MGYAVIMFVALMIMSVVMITAVTYGIAKDSQIAPLKAKNDYAERETGKAQTGLTIVDTCLGNSGRYLKGSGSENPSGPHTLYLTVRNNGSTVLNSTKATVLYNNSYRNFTATSGNVWAPLKNASMQVPDIYIPTPDNAPNPAIRLLVATENGITAIAPTSPANFTGRSVKANTSFEFTWEPSTDDTGIAYYTLHSITSAPTALCPPEIDAAQIIPGNSSASSMSEQYACGGNCQNTYFFLTAVDMDGNMGVPSRTVKCAPSQGGECSY